MAGVEGESTHGPRGDEPELGSVLWSRNRGDAGGFRLSRGFAVASGFARLAGGGIHEARLVAEENAQAHRDERDVPAVESRHAGTQGARSVECPARARSAF